MFPGVKARGGSACRARYLPGGRLPPTTTTEASSKKRSFPERRLGGADAEFEVNSLPSFPVYELWPRMQTEPVCGAVPLEAPVITTQEADDEDIDSDDLLDEMDQEEEPVLDPDHRFWGIKERLVQHAQAQFAESHHSHPSIREKAQTKHRSGIFACPFFRRDPARYRTCLADPSPTIHGLKRHLFHRHSQPFYCPVCYGVFRLASERDVHIKGRTCERREVVWFDGMTPEQKAVISRCRGPGTEQWRGIWSILFGRSEGVVLEPSLEPGLAWGVTLVREFWEARGREITEEFVEMEGGVACQGDDESSLSGLAHVVLQDLVGLVYWHSGLVRNLGNIPHRTVPFDLPLRLSTAGA